VTKMDRMFESAKIFNQNLSGWCVETIKSEPSYFDSKAALWTRPKPNWGTCPRGENQ
jgi:hypothetical protein